MTGHWTYDDTGIECEDLDDMWEYIRDHEYYSDEIDMERWLDDHYHASQIWWRLKDESAGQVYIDLIDEFEEDVWWPSAQDDPVEGEDYDYNGFLFKWVETEEEDEGDDDE